MRDCKTGRRVRTGFRFVIVRRTVSRHLTRLGLGKRRFIDPGGEYNRKPGKITARWPGHMVHLDVKKDGLIPDGGGWRIHGRDSNQAKVATEFELVMSAQGLAVVPGRLLYDSVFARCEATSAMKCWRTANGNVCVASK